jgi:SAM-dependent methyltransferase
LHRLNNWGLFSLTDWEVMSRRTAEFIGIAPGDSIFEAGCGSGAFLDVLSRHYGARIAGVDLAANLVDIAKSRLVGDFRVGDIQDMTDFEDNAYDKVVSQGVFLYLPSLAVVERAVKEMIRLAKPGGAIYVGVLNDPERLATYSSAHQPSGHAFIRRDFWYDIGARHGLDVECIDQERIFSKPEGYDGHSRLRYSVRMRKPGA